MNVFHKITLKALAINRTRTIVTIIGIILSVSMITAVTTLISSLQNFMLRNAIYAEGDWHGGFYDIDRKTVEKIRDDEKIRSVAVAENIGYADIGSSNEYKPYLFVMGADDLFLERMPIHLVSGRLPGSPEEIILPSHLASNGNVTFKAGDVIRLEIGDRYFQGVKLMQYNSYIHPDDLKESAGNDSDTYIDGADETSRGRANTNGADGADMTDGDGTDTIGIDGADTTGEDETGSIGRDGADTTGENGSDAAGADGAESGTAPGSKGEELVIRETREYTVVGFYERPNFEDYSAPGYTAITKISPDDAINSFAVYFKMNNPKETFNYMDNFETAKTVNNDVLRFSGVSKYDNFYTVLYSLAAILIGLIMFGSVSLIYNAFAISVSERTRQFGMLASVGATKKQTRRMVLFEALVVSSIGIPLGILSGILGIGVTINFVGDKFPVFYGAQSLSMDLHVTLASIIVACVVALITVLISAWIPSRRATKVSAIDAIRLSRDIRVKPREVKTSSLIYRLFGLEGMIAAKHFKRSKKKYRATVVSLFLSTVLFISTSSFCAYLTDAVTSNFQNSDYDIACYYRPANAEDLNPENLKAIHDGILSASDSIVSSSYVMMNTTSINIPVNLLSDDYVKYYNMPGDVTEVGIHTMIYGIGDDVYLQYLKRNRFNEETYMDKNNPRGLGEAIISRFDPSLQKFVRIPVLKNTSVTLNYEDYDYKKLNGLTTEEWQAVLENGDDNKYKINMPLELDIIETDLVVGLNDAIRSGIKIMYPMSVYMEMFKSVSCDFYFQAKNITRAFSQIENYLAENYPDSTEFVLINEYEMNESDRNMVTIIKVFSYGFIILISLIALANVFNTISTNIMLRRREFAMLKSVGMTRKGFKKMMNFECVLYGIKSLMWGIPAAFFVTWLIYRSISGGYDTAFYLPWASVAIAIGSVFAVVFATMVYSMRKINRDNPIDALKNDN